MAMGGLKINVYKEIVMVCVFFWQERKLKEQQKAQKKMNRTKKDSRSCLNTSTSGISGILQDMGQSEDNLVGI